MNPVGLARAAVKAVCGLLVTATPEALEKSAQLLRDACALESAVRESAGLETLGEIRELRASVCRASILLARAYAYHLRWRALISQAAAGYRADGAPAPTQFQASICFRA
jgi:hypothetical protein